MRKIISFVLLVLLVILTTFIVKNFDVLNVVTGFAAKSTCSCTFEGGRDLASIETGDNDIMPVKFATNTINFDEKSVSSTFFGLQKRTAVYREGVGCVLISEDNEALISLKPVRTTTKTNLPFPYGDLPQKDTIFKHIDYKNLDKAVANVFDAPGEKLKRTRAVLVIYKDQIIAEKYADGFSKDSKMLG